jgi:hypothetical protein
MACQLDGFMPPPTRGSGGFFPDPLWANRAQRASELAGEASQHSNQD